MQFFQLTTIIALAASATAAAVPVEARTVATDAFNGGLQLCRETSGACHFGGVEDCSSKGWGEPYNCQTFGLVSNFSIWF